MTTAISGGRGGVPHFSTDRCLKSTTPAALLATALFIAHIALVNGAELEEWVRPDWGGRLVEPATDSECQELGRWIIEERKNSGPICPEQPTEGKSLLVNEEIRRIYERTSRNDADRLLINGKVSDQAIREDLTRQMVEAAKAREQWLKDECPPSDLVHSLVREYEQRGCKDLQTKQDKQCGMGKRTGQCQGGFRGGPHGRF